ncbi:serine/threonine-protein kinase MPS1 isoform X3 [Juglans microcarpa x Juglans regia]|uniref:serine/threonine-protein kinase MPS1 isoform X3 n=1 Tax=Juglans microcarpa x Juglans regia TaxID=2249226 RepID=UPI001B7ED4F4|nr:serine/threonine-protein kinase MPS1 isoform X3 [Juglans microcarpa x Juglans regia]
MDREANLPVAPGPARNLIRPTAKPPDTTSSSFSSSPPDFLRNVQAAFKRHRPLVSGTGQSHILRPRRILVPQREGSRSSASNVGPMLDAEKSQDVVSLSQGHMAKDSIAGTKSTATVLVETQEDASITPPSILGTTTKTFDESLHQFDARRDQPKPITGCQDNDPMASLSGESQDPGGQKKVLSSTRSNAVSQEMEWIASSQVEASTIVNHDSKHRNFQNTESEISLRSDGGITSLLAKRTTAVQDQLHQFKNFLSQPATQSSVVGPSCATTTSVHSTSAPILNLTTSSSHLHRDSSSHVAVESLGDFNKNASSASQGNMVKLSNPSPKDISGVLIGQTSIAAKASNSATDIRLEVKEYDPSKEQQNRVPKEGDAPENPSLLDDKSTKGYAGDVTNVQSQPPLSKNTSSNAKLESSKSEKQERIASGKGTSAPRKRNYDPDLFFKVNGKLYQRLGKIGSGGSSEVHKVISADCTIYALKKIKLKGRDYATAFGFCQEIGYLNKLKGKNNIIQLIDHEVTDKALLQEVMNGSMSNKDGRVKDDGYIYMVLEYGEIDLAHMLSQKWKEMDGTNQTIDENWLRFYWQQILQAVNTIHEERIVHSDLKPANFLLVKGFLKLIDFGIAKAIMSDTTNIQRDSQVGTLSYMSPEAFMCNENDANGNIIKCGRPSDIWSLGCILYQMVYGRTPFSEYKTFWAKFKVITDPNHEIMYGPVPNPWLLDLMKKCLAWDRNERWRIPQLLQHPFLVPPVPPRLVSSQDQSCKLLRLIADTCASDEEASMLCCQLEQLLREPDQETASQLLTSRDQQCQLLSQMSNLCFQLHERLANSTG